MHGRTTILGHVPDLYFTVSPSGNQPLPARRNVNRDLLIRVRLPVHAEDWPPRYLKTETGQRGHVSWNGKFVFLLLSVEFCISYSEIPTDDLFVFPGSAVETHAIQGEGHRRDAALVTRELAEVPEAAVALRDQLYRVLPRACEEKRSCFKSFEDV